MFFGATINNETSSKSREKSMGAFYLKLKYKNRK